MSKNLITFSGGADSTHLVYKLLTETSDENTLVVLVNQPSPGKNKKDWGLTYEAGLEKINPVLDELRKYGNFNVILEEIDYSLVQSVVDDSWWAYMTKRFAGDFNSGVYNKFVSAIGYEQQNGKFLKNSNVLGIRPTFEAKKIFEETVTAGQFWQPFTTNDFYQNYNRWHLYKYLPLNLQEKTLSCYKVPACGKCGKCCYDSKVRACIAAGWTSENLQDWVYEKSQYYGGGNGRDSRIIDWIKLETTDVGIGYNLRNGISNGTYSLLELDTPPLSHHTRITDKASFEAWYDTIEYTVPTDYALLNWGLTKEDYWLTSV